MAPPALDCAPQPLTAAPKVFANAVLASEEEATRNASRRFMRTLSRARDSAATPRARATDSGMLGADTVQTRAVHRAHVARIAPEVARMRAVERMKRAASPRPSRIAALGLVAAVGLAGCTGELDAGPTGSSTALAPITPAPPAMHRLTASEHRATLSTLFPGYALPAAADLPGDTPLHGFSTVGASELTIDAVAAEEHEQAALALAAATLATPEARMAFYGCDVATGDDCVRTFIMRFGRAAWRRPLTTDEVTTLVDLDHELAGIVRDPWRAISYVTAAIVQSPHFLFRVEIGESDPDDPRRLRFTSVEMASRLSFFLWGGPPDDALLTRAVRGDLATEEGVRDAALEMMEDPRARAQMIHFFSEFFALDRLATAEKNTELFPEWTPTLEDSMRIEIEELVGDAWDRDADVREMFSTDVTFVDTELAALYGLPDPGAGRRVRTTLPASARRGGLLGRGAILATYAHATISSPVRRGKFVVSNVLCRDIPPPPPGVPELPEDDGSPRTQRMRLERHVSDPGCASCHQTIDPPGLALEHFDAIGRYRTTENTLPIDAEVVMFGTDLEGADGLGDYLAGSPAVGACFARRMFRFGVGHLETEGELPAMRQLERALRLGEYRLRELAIALVTSEAFRYASIPDAECEEDDTRACENACGSGEETCAHGSWSDCSAPTGGAETCNGMDDDCDGTSDEAIARDCTSECGAGTEMCVAGAFTACSARTPGAESCNRADDDCDGITDEGFRAIPVSGSFSTLRSFHAGCDGAAQRLGEQCNSAIDSFCTTSGDVCGTAGFGPAENSGDTAHFTCVSAERIETSYAELSASHAGCDGTTQRVGRECNAAIHRFCNARGLTTGFGPVQTGGSAATIACVRFAELVSTTYTELSSHHGGCTAAVRSGPECNSAIHRLCVSRGATSGFGPLENSGDGAEIACVRP